MSNVGGYRAYYGFSIDDTALLAKPMHARRLIAPVAAVWPWKVHMVLLPRRALARRLAGDAPQIIKGWLAFGP